MNRSEALRAGPGYLAALAALAPGDAQHRPIRLSEFAFALGIGPERAIGVLFETPEIVVESPLQRSRRFIVPRAAGNDDRWHAASVPAQFPGTDVDTHPGSDVRYGHILDRATGLCRGPGGAYIAMLAFPTLPYLVYYDVAKERFWTRALPTGQAVIGLFVQPSRLYFVHAGTPILQSVELVEQTL